MYLGPMRSLIRSPSGPPPTVTYIGSTSTALIDGGTQTASGVSIGTANANRRVIAVYASIVRYSAVTNMTIGGTGTFVGTFRGAASGGSYSGQVAYAYADIAAGATADVVVTGGGANGDGQWLCHIYTVDKSNIVDVNPVTASTANDPAGTSAAISINTQSGGFVITNMGPYLVGQSLISITASDETFSSNYTTGNNHSYSVSNVSARTPSSITYGWTGSVQCVVAALTWR